MILNYRTILEKPDRFAMLFSKRYSKGVRK